MLLGLSSRASRIIARPAPPPALLTYRKTISKQNSKPIQKSVIKGDVQFGYISPRFFISLLENLRTSRVVDPCVPWIPFIIAMENGPLMIFQL